MARHGLLTTLRWDAFTKNGLYLPFLIVTQKGSPFADIRARLARVCIRTFDHPHLICSILQVDRQVDGITYDSIATQKAVDLVRATRMGSLCYPTRGHLKGGSETVPTTVGTKSWGGSEFTSFLMTAGAVTNTHIDMHVVHDREFDVPAAGTMWSVARDHVGPAKRAIVMCSHDKERVIQALRLNTTKTATCQCSGTIASLEGLVPVLKAHRIRFVVMEFPSSCSYIIPSGCAHTLVTLGLIETCAWHPSLGF